MIEFNKVPPIKDINLENIQAVIFDMDGTLLNSEIIHAQALLQLLGDTSEDVENLLREFVGVAEPDVYQTLLEKNIIPNITFDEFLNLKNSSFRQILKNKEVVAKLLDKKILKLIKNLKEKKMIVALVTASERETTQIFLDELKISDYFDLILTRNDTEKTKPDPMPYLKSFELLKIEPHQALIFEDSITGLEAAVKSNANVCKVAWY